MRLEIKSIFKKITFYIYTENINNKLPIKHCTYFLIYFNFDTKKIFYNNYIYMHNV